MATSDPGRPGAARVALDNGAVVIAKETHKTPAVALNLAVRAGSIVRPGGSPGAAFCCRASSIAGRPRDRPIEIAEELDSRGISLTMTSPVTCSRSSCTCLAEDFDAVLAIVADIVMSPSVPDGELATRKGEVITAIRQDEDNPARPGRRSR